MALTGKSFQLQAGGFKRFCIRHCLFSLHQRLPHDALFGF